MARVRYHATPRKQALRFKGKLIGCTDTSFAMLVDAATMGGVLVSEAQVRALSDEKHPDPNSPGLNLDQLDDVAKKLHVEFAAIRGGNRAAFIHGLNLNRRYVAQLWYSGIGGTDIGHAVFVEQHRSGKAPVFRIVDPMKGAYSFVAENRLFTAMETFSHKAGGSGLWYGQSRPTQFLSANQEPAK